MVFFYFKNNLNKNKKGWYEYSNYFLNVLIALDKCNSKNGTIEMAKSFRGNFFELYKYTKKNNTPDIEKKYEKKLRFEMINLEKGDCVFLKIPVHTDLKKIKRKKIEEFFIIHIQ